MFWREAYEAILKESKSDPKTYLEVVNDVDADCLGQGYENRVGIFVFQLSLRTCRGA